MQINRNTKIIAATAGLMARGFIGGDEVVAYPLPQGEMPILKLLRFNVEGIDWQFDEGVEVFDFPQIRFSAVVSPEHGDTSAVQDFRPSSANRQAYYFEQRLQAMQADMAAALARQRAELQAGLPPTPLPEAPPEGSDVVEGEENPSDDLPAES